MKVRKVVAGAILAAVLPVLADVATEPYADRNVPESWVYGAGKLAFLGVIQWAAGAFREDEGTVSEAKECLICDD